jgi:uncharacterized protein YndB with AHSA1/START domain
MAAATTEPAGDATDRVIEIARVFDAPRALVFKCWLEPKHILRWFYASEGWTTPYAETDVRPGGAFCIGFASPDGKSDFDFEGVYNAIVEPERLVFTIADGRPVTVTFVEDEGERRAEKAPLSTGHDRRNTVFTLPTALRRHGRASSKPFISYSPAVREGERLA